MREYLQTHGKRQRGCVDWVGVVVSAGTRIVANYSMSWKVICFIYVAEKWKKESIEGNSFLKDIHGCLDVCKLNEETV